MDPARLSIIVMYTASALLPLWGLRGLYVTATREAKIYAAASAAEDPDTPTIDQFDTLVVLMHKATKRRPRDTLKDMLVIGAGLCLGAGASIWSLFLPTMN